MGTEHENPYAASQVLHEKNFSPIWRSLIYRACIGFLVGVAFYVLVNLFGSEEKNRIGFILLTMCVIVSAVSTFTQSETAKKNGRTGIIAAIMLCLASLVITTLFINALFEAPPHFKGYEEERAQYRKDHLQHHWLGWIFLYATLVCGYFFLYCRQQSKNSDTNEQAEHTT